MKVADWNVAISKQFVFFSPFCQLLDMFERHFEDRLLTFIAENAIPADTTSWAEQGQPDKTCRVLLAVYSTRAFTRLHADPGSFVRIGMRASDWLGATAHVREICERAFTVERARSFTN